jgi:hypothetical protein
MAAAAMALIVKPAVVTDKRMIACSDDYSPGAIPRLL